MVTHCGPGGVVLGGLLSRSCPWRMGFFDSIPVGGGREEGEEFLILCDFVPVSSEEGLEMGEVWGIGCN